MDSATINRGNLRGRSRAIIVGLVLVVGTLALAPAPKAEASLQKAPFCHGYIQPKTWCKTSNVNYWGGARATSNNAYQKCVIAFRPNGQPWPSTKNCQNDTVVEHCFFEACESLAHHQRTQLIRGAVYNATDSVRWIEGTISWDSN